MDIQIKDLAAFNKIFLDEYLANGMGTMSKREIDILVMHLLLEYGGLADASNYDLSLMLKLTETRIKGLRYEARLKYPTNDDYVKEEFLIVLGRAQFELDKNDQSDYEKMKVSFIIEDTYLRQAIQGRLKSMGRFADSSFNSEIVKVECGALLTVMEGIYGTEVSQKFREAFKKLSKEGQKNIGKKAGETMIPVIVDIAKSILTKVAVEALSGRLGVGAG